MEHDSQRTEDDERNHFPEQRHRIDYEPERLVCGQHSACENPRRNEVEYRRTENDSDANTDLKRKLAHEWRSGPICSHPSDRSEQRVEEPLELTEVHGRVWFFKTGRPRQPPSHYVRNQPEARQDKS